MALKKELIIEEALVLLNQSGIEGVTLRKLAKRLDVQAPALYWHFKNKEVLIHEMAEAILKKEFAEWQPKKQEESWQAYVISLFVRLRKALLAYTDGGRVVAGAHLSLTMADVTEEAIKSLLNTKRTLYTARLQVLTATHYTFGRVIEEQAHLTQEDMQGFHMESFEKEHPYLIQGIKEYFSTGRTVDDLFNDGLNIIFANEL
ncbi:TetR/AcrR family tetracycline transcriptional repressor [Pullulanibacillus pueri]|uniref:TetR family transcriptional regulator n=1 Tax=Pullulanibacillus pueri TaxID=1437324 RepID=A0A8J3A0D0_9BACL|nr:TetR family transcriptional regulator [Pullulanibacillus pueri]MBM7683905.1 TetR/AcrR family tetracycline transcriptional repressor [Pullulanibacillus pueri]GGH87818.1 TetR family transcriptional regulator [Pullulanibacillus pueri]